MVTDNNLEEKIKNEAMRLSFLLINKNKDYGSSIFMPCLFDEKPVQNAIAVRVSDKIRRLQTLVRSENNGESSASPETIDDTLLDLAGYCLMWRIARYNSPE